MGGLLSAIAGGGIDLRSNAMETDARSNLLEQQRQALQQTTPIGLAATQAGTAATQAGTEEQLLKNQILKQQVADQGIMRDALIKHPTDPQAMVSEALKNGISYNGHIAQQQLFQTLAGNAAKLTSEQAKARSDVLGLNGGALEEYSKLPDTEKAQQWPAVAQQLNQNEPGAFDPAKPLIGANLQLAIGAHNLEGKITDQRLKAAQTEEANATAAKANTENQFNQQRLAALKDPQTLTKLYQQIDATIPAAQGGVYAEANNTAKQAVAGALAAGGKDAPEKAQAAIKDSSDAISRHQIAVATAKEKAPITINVARQEQAMRQGAGLSPEAIDMAAEMYAHTGVLPGSARDILTRRQIMNRAAELAPNIDLASNAAAYHANKASLTGLQKNLDSVTAFENTANKNLDLFLGTAGKIIDSGSPWINKPLRDIDQKGLGSSDLAAFNAARQVAVNEIAKVTGNPSLSGQLSDSARKEVENFIPANATLKQTYAVAKVLRQDMANRKTAYQEQLSDIKSRIGGGGAQPHDNAPFKPGDTYNGHKVLKVTKVE